MIQTLFSFLPVLFLIWLMVKKKSMPSFKALPLSALVLYVICFLVFKQEANLIHANVIRGLLVAWTPLLIIAGAIFLFRTMEATGSMKTISEWLNRISENKIAQLMIVGWTFVTLIEGASGFGTPAALAAPILVGLGFPPLRVAVLALIMNSASVSFGAVGMPTWFGFSGIELSEQETLSIGFKSAVMHSLIAFVVPVMALNQVVFWNSIKKNAGFIFISLIATVGPYLVVAYYSFEFPSLVGGVTGLACSIFAAQKGWGLSEDSIPLKGDLDSIRAEVSVSPPVKNRVLIQALLPLWGTLLVLVVTRISPLGIKSLLLSLEPALKIPLGFFGEFWLSVSFVVGLDSILGTGVKWSHPILYVPSLVPFLLVALITFKLYGSKPGQIRGVFKETSVQMKKPIAALLGALVFVNLMMMGGESSAVNHMGKALAIVTGSSWNFFASFMGALGTFFSGSATISNLTFGAIQDSIARTLELNKTTVLALQSVGGSLGTMISINNIVAVASVLALGNAEGEILKKTSVPMVVYATLAGVIAFFVF